MVLSWLEPWSSLSVLLAGSAQYVEAVDAATSDEIVSRLVSVLEPG